jgi:hypothetical protein
MASTRRQKFLTLFMLINGTLIDADFVTLIGADGSSFYPLLPEVMATSATGFSAFISGLFFLKWVPR